MRTLITGLSSRFYQLALKFGSFQLIVVRDSRFTNRTAATGGHSSGTCHLVGGNTYKFVPNNQSKSQGFKLKMFGIKIKEKAENFGYDRLDM